MKKHRIIVNKMEYLEYEICSYLLRNRILKAYIHAPNQSIMDRLSEYMYLCQIPHCYIDDSFYPPLGYVLTCSTNSEGNEKLSHIYLSINENEMIPDGDEVYQLQLDGDVKITDLSESIDLDKVPIHLKNSQIRKMFLYAFKVAETEIDIISPWMNAGVIDDQFLSLMDNAFSRGVKIKIIYGLKPNSNDYNLSRSRRSDQMAEMMKTRFADKGDLFSIKRDNIHYKLVLCDEKYKLEGGFNYLSFVGNYDDPDTRHEGSPFGRDVEEIRFLREEYFEG